MQIINGQLIPESESEKQMLDSVDIVRVHFSNDYCINGKFKTSISSMMTLDKIIKRLEEMKKENIVVNSANIEITFINLDKIEGEWNGV